ncbi:hypothetical protein PIB30_096716 [Stylosanthes scabra]|uniref:Uncharacterized protein n=1 Tax=Stylosanthes scabra TaxID=79078 RepID=A0ABU6YUB1_9FABA|nr:hypothetical protein [Stylosanthes scabra]
MKKELKDVNLRSENIIPSWFSYSTVEVGAEASHHHGRVAHNNNPPILFSSQLPRPLPPSSLSTIIHRENPNPNNSLIFEGMAASHSATALLQKASEIGAKPYLHDYHHHHHVPESTTTLSSMPPMSSSLSSVSGLLEMASREEIGTRMMFARYHQGFLESYESNNKADDEHTKEASLVVHGDMMMDHHGTSSTSFEEALMMRGMVNNNPKREDGDDNNKNDFDELVSRSVGSHHHGGFNDETRDFLGIGVFSQRELFDLSALHHHHLDSSSYGNQQNQKQPPWQG